MTKITLRQLRYFEALAQHCHFGIASNACSVTQPALSMQIRDFELALGVSLFEKGTHPVQLTPLGRSKKQSHNAGCSRVGRACSSFG